MKKKKQIEKKLRVQFRLQIMPYITTVLDDDLHGRLSGILLYQLGRQLRDVLKGRLYDLEIIE